MPPVRSGPLSLDEGCNSLLDTDGTLAGVCAAGCKVDPARVESLDHLYAGGGILHAFARKIDSHFSRGTTSARTGAPERFGERCSQSIRRDALRALQLDYTLALPTLLQ